MLLPLIAHPTPKGKTTFKNLFTFVMASKDFRIGSLVIHSGSFEKSQEKTRRYGIVVGFCGPWIDFGKRRSVLVYWDFDCAQDNESWEAPRNIRAIQDLLAMEGVEGEEWR